MKSNEFNTSINFRKVAVFKKKKRTDNLLRDQKKKTEIFSV